MILETLYRKETTKSSLKSTLPFSIGNSGGGGGNESARVGTGGLDNEYVASWITTDSACQSVAAAPLFAHYQCLYSG